MSDEEIAELVEKAYFEGFFEAWHLDRSAPHSKGAREFLAHGERDPVRFADYLFAKSESAKLIPKPESID